MGTTTAISWTDHTFNTWWGCQRVSPGCENCYAETFAKRTGNDVWGKNADRRRFGDKHWNEPFKWNRSAESEGRRHRVFCASMADVFEDREDHLNDRDRLFDTIHQTPWLDWQLLTKRPENVLKMVPYVDASDWPDNVWIGATVEDQKRADERVPVLLEIPAKVRFLSCEPLLGSVVLRPSWTELELRSFGGDGVECFPRVDWVIVGGESGPKHRPLNLDAARHLRDQCLADGVPFFFKQVGGLRPTSGGDLLDGVAHKEFPNARSSVTTP